MSLWRTTYARVQDLRALPQKKPSLAAIIEAPPRARTQASVLSLQRARASIQPLQAEPGQLMSACKNRKEHFEFIVVLQRYSRRSAFDGYRVRLSKYSTLFCAACNALWRTKADYVSKHPSGTIEEADKKWQARRS